MNQHQNSYSYVRYLEQRATKEEWNQQDPFLSHTSKELNSLLLTFKGTEILETEHQLLFILH